MNRSRTIATALLITTLFLSASRTDYMTELAEVTRLNASEITELEIEDRRLYLMSPLNSKTFGQVTLAFERQPEIDTLVLTAMPGSVDDETTFKMARWLRDKGIKTHLLSRSVIASGAVDLFLAGTERTAEVGAQLGVHSWSDGRQDAKDLSRDHGGHQLNASYVEAMLGEDAFYWYTIDAAPSEELHWLGRAEVAEFSLLTSPWLEPSNDPTPFGGKFSEMRAALLED
ncbi:MAG: hypothetical protein AAGA21_14110 [Pseudomonadota bacterium]